MTRNQKIIHEAIRGFTLPEKGSGDRHCAHQRDVSPLRERAIALWVQEICAQHAKNEDLVSFTYAWCLAVVLKMEEKRRERKRLGHLSGALKIATALIASVGYEGIQFCDVIRCVCRVHYKLL